MKPGDIMDAIAMVPLGILTVFGIALCIVVFLISRKGR